MKNNMEKKELIEKINEVKAQIKSNSKDAHFADKLISDLLSLKGQLEHKPTLVHIPLDSVTQQLDEKTFTMSLTKDGKAVYHLKGGYTLIADNRLVSLYNAIASYVLNKDLAETLSEEEKELLRLDMDCTQYVFSVPCFAFSDMDLKVEIGKMMINHLRKLQETLIDNVKLQDETPDENKLFEDATIGIETLSDNIEKQ